MCFPLKFFSSRNKVGIYQFLRPNKKRTLPRSNPIADKTNGTRTITSWFWRWNHVFALKNKTKRPLLFTQKRSQAFFGGFWQPQKFPPKNHRHIHRSHRLRGSVEPTLLSSQRIKVPTGPMMAIAQPGPIRWVSQWFLKETVQWWWWVFMGIRKINRSILGQSLKKLHQLSFVVWSFISLIHGFHRCQGLSWILPISYEWAKE